MKEYLTKLCMFLFLAAIFSGRTNELGGPNRRAYWHRPALAGLPEVRSGAETPPDCRR